MNTAAITPVVIQPQRPDTTYVGVGDSAWASLYRVAGVAALAQVLITAIQIPIFILHPPPSTVADFFALFASNRLLGLLNLDVLMMANGLLFFPILLALFAALRRDNEPFMALALILGVVANALCFVWNGSFTMLALSDQYAAATGEAERAMILAAGQATLTTHLSGTAFDLYYVLGGVTILIIAAVMARSTVFGKTTARVGLVVGALMLVPPTVGTIGLYLSLIVLLPLSLWFILVARRLFQLR